MARKPRTKKYLSVDLDGPLFDENIAETVAAALNQGMAETGREGEGVLIGFIHTTGFVKTGDFAAGVDSELRTKDPREPGYVKVGVFSGAWPEHGRPTRTWAERGERGGKKLRKGLGIFSKTQRRIGDFSFDNMERHLEEALN